MLLLWGFYVLFLERENMHYTKRFYLIFSVVFALSIPLITFTYTTDIQLEKQITQEPSVTTIMAQNEAPMIESSIDYVGILLCSMYSVGIFIFGFRFIKNLHNLTKKIRNNERLKEPSHVNVLVDDTIVPYTFLRYIFLSKKEYQDQNIPEEVLLHEKTHVAQKHTLDILFIEMLQVIFWFNPLLFWIKKSIKLNHEFLADQKVLKRQYSLQTYMNLLVTYPNNSNQVELASPINYSLTKKRIVMMSKQFSKTRAAARLLLLLPILLGCMLLFNNKIIAQQKNVNYTKTIQNTDPNKKIRIRVKNEQITVNGTATKLDNFSKTIDAETKQWKDNELTEFQFDVQIMNSNDVFIQKLNDEYRKSRLYGANPDGHDLIPPAPPKPEIPNVKIGGIPSPPSISKTINTDKNLLAPPAPPKVPSPPVHPDIDVEIDDNENDIEGAIEAAEQARVEAAVEREYALANMMEVEMHAQEAAEIARKSAVIHANQAREQAEKARAIAIEAAHRAADQSHRQRDLAMRHAEMSRLEAENVREMAIREARIAKERILHERDKLHEEARAAAEKARRHAEKARKEAMEEAKKVRKEARKIADAARKEARKEIEKARKEREKERKKAEKERDR